MKLFILILCALVQGCSKLDDYMLGKDNTPQPKELKLIKDKITVEQNWTVAAGKSSKNKEYLRLKPVVQGGVIYTADASGLVRAINKHNGQVKWTTVLKHGLVSGPAVASGYIAVGTNNSSLVVLNKSNGNKLWQKRLPVKFYHLRLF